MATYIGETQGNYLNGAHYNIQTQDMTGKVYEDLEDMGGKKDERIMLFSASSGISESWLYKVYNTVEELLRDWSFSVNYTGSHRVSERLVKMTPDQGTSLRSFI